MPKYMPLTKTDLRERIKEIEQRIQAMDRRDKLMGDLKKWMEQRKLTVLDLQHMIKVLKPKRTAAAVKSKKPLQPIQPRAAGVLIHQGTPMKPKGDPEFRRAIKEVRLEKGLSARELGKKIGIRGNSINNWESGRYVPSQEGRAKLVKALGLPAGLGAEASAAIATTNGRAAE